MPFCLIWQIQDRIWKTVYGKERYGMNISEIFGTNVFSVSVMRERLPKKVFAEVQRVMENGGQISMETADCVANAMKDWALEKRCV